ncbi:hypothetical protein [Halorhabdus tiamatea]|nr:hypothetical protein [Halorhabdus tiamatea]
MRVDPQDLELEDQLDRVGVGAVPATDSGCATHDLNWTIPADEFESLLETHADKIDEIVTFSSELREGMRERACTQDLFVLFVDPDAVDTFHDDVLPSLEPEPEEDTTGTTTAAETIVWPVRQNLVMWKNAILFLLIAVMATLLLPIRVVYRVYRICRSYL